KRPRKYLLTSKSVKRISDVKLIRTAQFAEDSGPMAHQVRPDSYIEINNFYTLTVYYKGAELIRMLYNLLGKDGYYKGMNLYFDRYDGQAVTTEDFVKSMEDANSVDLQQFRLWYTQAGTPEITVKTEFDSARSVFELTLEQKCPPTPDQNIKHPFHIPIEIGLLDSEGNELPLYLEGGETEQGKHTMILNLKKSMETFRFSNISSRPVPSILRNFSAPVKLISDIENEELLFLMSSDSDEFNQWESAQLLMTRTILNCIEESQQRQLTLKDWSNALPEKIQELIKAQKAVLENASLDKAFLVQVIALPTESYLAEQMKVIDIEMIHVVREVVKVTLAKALREEFLSIYRSFHTTETYCFNAQSVGRRSLKNLALSFLMSLNDEESLKLCKSQFENANNMTDEISALALLANRDYPYRNDALKAFYSKWRKDPLVMNMWLSVQASSQLSQVDDIKRLMRHPVFEFKNPNKLRALIGTFCNANLINFHVADGTGYYFLANQIIKLDKINSQIASRLLAPFIQWKRFDEKRGSLMKSQLERIVRIASLSKDVYEVVSKCLK
ncbi:DUF3458 domain-containing protein, partial [bacterium]|nr:DUF3458 domain-containing protein [bacterium]